MDVTILLNNGVDVNHGLELLGDMDMYNETLGDFLTESQTRVPNIINYYNNQDWVNYEILVHAQKSDSKYLGFTTLAEMSYNHEMASKENPVNVQYIIDNIGPLIDETKRIIAVVNAYLESRTLDNTVQDNSNILESEDMERGSSYGTR